MKLAHEALLGLILGAVSLQAAAVPIRATFNGTVNADSDMVDLGEVAAGTAASFDVTFDDSGLLPGAPLTDFDLGPVSGWLRIGALEWSLDAGEIWTYSYFVAPGNPINYYGLQLTGTGRGLGSSAGLFGLFLTLTPTLNPYSSTSLAAGFAYPFEGGGTLYNYANFDGSFAASRVTTSVPEPGTTLPLLSMLLLVWAGRRYSAKVSVAR